MEVTKIATSPFDGQKPGTSGSTKSGDGISATELHGEFRTMYFGLDSPGRKEKLYPSCRRRWKVLYARSHSAYRENGSGK